MLRQVKDVWAKLFQNWKQFLKLWIVKSPQLNWKICKAGDCRHPGWKGDNWILCVRIQVRPAEANGSGMTSWKVPDNWNILGSSKSIQTPTYNDKFHFSLERDVNTYPCREKVGTKMLWLIQTISNWRILWHFLKVSMVSMTINGNYFKSFFIWFSFAELSSVEEWWQRNCQV